MIGAVLFLFTGKVLEGKSTKKTLLARSKVLVFILPR